MKLKLTKKTDYSLYEIRHRIGTKRFLILLCFYILKDLNNNFDLTNRNHHGYDPEEIWRHHENAKLFARKLKVSAYWTKPVLYAIDYYYNNFRSWEIPKLFMDYYYENKSKHENTAQIIKAYNETVEPHERVSSRKSGHIYHVITLMEYIPMVLDSVLYGKDLTIPENP